jgi:hypothetical protein
MRSYARGGSPKRSGLDAATGLAPGRCTHADITLTLHMPKPGLLASQAGDLLLADLGIPASVTKRAGAVAPSYGLGFVTELRRVQGS